MNRCLRCVLSGLVIAGGMVALAAGATTAAEPATCTLQLKRLAPTNYVRLNNASNDYMDLGNAPDDSIYRMVDSQDFFLQIRDKDQEKSDEDLANFRRVVKKEPKYESDHPFRAVAKLGGKEYAFAIDKKNAKSKSYDRLYFDANRNGDLTDDKPIDGQQEFADASRSSCTFPQVNVTLDIDGTKVAYAFSMRVYAQMANEFKYASISLSAEAYREGQIELEGKKRHIVLLDNNGNGRFDDPIKVEGDDVAIGTNARIYPDQGDLLLVDPKADALGYDPESNPNRHQVSKLVNIDGRYYGLEISPAGDKLTLTPSSTPLGYVASPHEGFRATLYGDQGCINITCGKSSPAAVPAGQWKLLSYTIDQTEHAAVGKPKEEGKEKPAAEKPKEGSLLGALGQAIFGIGNDLVAAGPRYTVVSASGSTKCPAIKVAAGETVKLPYGPPYKPEVTAHVLSTGTDGAKEAQLQMSLIGAAGESCTNLMVGGDRPPAPKFTITTAKGDVVETGTFKYG
jgi:hypothetical protein